MTEKDQLRRTNFNRLFPPAVEKLLDRLRVVKQKSVKSNYAWDEALVHDAWVQIARIFAQTADSFGVKFEVLVNGVEVDYVEPKSTKRTAK